MGLSTTALIPRRAFLALGLAAGSACLTACSGKGSYDDGYAVAMLLLRQTLPEKKKMAAAGTAISQHRVLSTPSRGRSAE